jgi:CcmD family protein
VEGSLTFLFAATAVVWIAIFLYLFSLSGRLDALRRELDALKRPERAGLAEDPEPAHRR